MKEEIIDGWEKRKKVKKINANLLNEVFSLYGFDKKKYIGMKIISQGHINSTYVLYFDFVSRVKRYLFQEINTDIFKDPNKLMQNIYEVTEYSKQKYKTLGINYKEKVLSILFTKEKKSFIKLSNGAYCRVYHYIENSVNYDTSSNEKIFYEAGHIIGEFQNILSDFPAEVLYPIITDFHNTIKRYSYFESTLEKASLELKDTCKDEIDFYKENKFIAYRIQNLIDEKKMPIRVTHNDTKINNLMFSYPNNEGRCLVDLDTVMPGCLCFDYGDFIRSGCNKGQEDDQNLNNVVLQKDLLLKFTKGFLEKTVNCITGVEVENLIFGAIDMTYECGMRFLTDYLQGNPYFKVQYPTHNLIRARTQIQMCKQLLENQKSLEIEIDNIYKTLKNK